MTINTAPSIVNIINISTAIVTAIHDNHYDMINATINYNMAVTVAAILSQ
jgi:hypothetical protein